MFLKHFTVTYFSYKITIQKRVIKNTLANTYIAKHHLQEYNIKLFSRCRFLNYIEWDWLLNNDKLSK